VGKPQRCQDIARPSTRRVFISEANCGIATTALSTRRPYLADGSRNGAVRRPSLPSQMYPAYSPRAGVSGAAR
jgi:hypothetical protein